MEILKFEEMRILLLEDSSTDAELTQISLINSIPGCAIRLATTLKDARSLIKNGERFDVALLDVALPDGNGQELLAEIRQSGVDMAVVMLTGSGNEEVAVAALKAGADDYVIKRQDYISHLSSTIHFAIENYKHTRQLRNDLLKLLYIEHNTTDLDLTLRHLKQYAPNIVVETVVTAEEVLLMLPKDQPSGKYQVILMDYRLPGLNALEFIKIMRQERKSDIPIILVSGQGNEDIAVQALKLGASEYLVKRENYLFRLPTLIASVYHHYELKRSQLALKESEAQYRLIAENSGDVIFTLDLDLNYTYISPAISSLRGYSPEEAMKQKINEVLTPESFERAVRMLSETLYLSRKIEVDSSLQQTIELEMIRKDGTTVWTEVKASLIVDENNQPIGILGVTRDISSRKFALDELRKLSRAVEQSPDSILITNTKAEIEYVNPALLKISGYSADELIGQNPRIFKSGKTPKSVYKTLWHTITKGDVWEGEFQNKRKNGEVFWDAATISPVTDQNGKITHYLAIRRDITEQKKSEANLQESEKKYRLLFDSNPHPMWVYDLETLNFLEVNHSAIMKYGYSRDEFLTMNLKDIRPPEDIELLDNNLKKEPNEYTFSGEWRHNKRNGDIFLVEIISHSINYAGKNARLVLANDITERKVTEDKLKLYTRAIEQSPVSLNITDNIGNIVYVNSGFTVLSGYTPKEAIGKNPRFLKSGVHSDKFYKELWETIIAGKNWSGELCNKNKNGNFYWVQATISPVVDSNGRITHFVAVKEDISERKKFVEDLRIAKEHAEESDRLKSAFLANMSHEIRTPLNSIIGFSELLSDEFFEPDQKKEFILSIIINGNNLLNIISDIIDISKIEAGQITIHKMEIPVANFMKEINAQYVAKVEEKNLTYVCNCYCNEYGSDVFVLADQERLRQVFNNLISNALKFTSEGGIEVGCKAWNEWVEFYVKDTGIGIPPEFHIVIFDRFRQVEGEKTRKYGGNGLGLAITKNLIELMGGRIWVESELGKGATFYFTLPKS